jgi:hypothetical protein
MHGAKQQYASAFATDSVFMQTTPANKLFSASMVSMNPDAERVEHFKDHRNR